MLCPNCNWELKYKGGENLEDFGCPNMDCPAREIGFYLNVKVRDNWWFSPGYSIPFKVNDKWLFTANSVGMNGMETNSYWLDEDHITQYSWGLFANPKWKHIVSIPYYALPVNQDFQPEFEKLKNRLLKCAILV